MTMCAYHIRLTFLRALIISLHKIIKIFFRLHKTFYVSHSTCKLKEVIKMNSNKSSPRVYSFTYGVQSGKSKIKQKSTTKIIDLPVEVRAPIWTYICNTTKKSLRLVCKTLKNDIDTRIGLAVDLDERLFPTRDVKSTIPTSASELRLWGSQQTQDYVNRLLLNCRLITQASFSGPTDLTNFKKILTRCEKLKSVEISDKTEFDLKLKIPLKIRSVSTLRLGSEGKFSDYNPSNKLNFTCWPTYANILENVSFPCLKILNIEYTMQNEKIEDCEFYHSILNSVLKYLIAHKTVNDLSLRVHKSKETSDEEKAFDFNFPSEKLESIRLKKLVVSTDADVMKIWEYILPLQSILEHLDFLNQSKEWSFFDQIIRKNSSSLKSVLLRKLVPVGYKFDANSRIDLSTFDTCDKLETLFLSRFANSTQEICGRQSQIVRKVSPAGGGGGDQHQVLVGGKAEVPFLQRISSKLPELICMKGLPESLKMLYIQGFTVKSEDLTWIPVRLKNLEVLELQLLGYRGHQPKELLNKVGDGRDEIPKDQSTHGLGVTTQVIKELVTNLRKLEKLFVEEWYNNRTWGVKDKQVQDKIKEINMIPGDFLLKAKGYFGVMIADSEPVFQERVDRSQRGDLWDTRFNQYRYQQWMAEKR